MGSPMRKVIQITGEGVYLCDDGTMWIRLVDDKWHELSNVPQPIDKLPTGRQIHDAYKISVAEPCDCRKSAGWAGANPMFKCKHTKD
jgi:hypothetical protein